MDRDNRWERIQQSYDLLTQWDARYFTTSATLALSNAYDRGEDDEFVAPTGIGDRATLADGDAVLFMNFRADRAKQLTQALTEDDFQGFDRPAKPALALITTTEYAASLGCTVAFPPSRLDNSLGEILAEKGLTQLRIAETEKYAHVTFFFSGGREATFSGETRTLIPSPDVATYDLQPEMSAPEGHRRISARHWCWGSTILSSSILLMAIWSGTQVSSTPPSQQVEALDECIGRVVSALRAHNGEGLITADHGNCEQMKDYANDQPHTQHTTERVPLIYLGTRFQDLDPAGGILADIAPTILTMMDLEIPSAMSGRNLLTR
jgi:2,3-bisphosphoglycerate-independent phosphoglycerate mutase